MRSTVATIDLEALRWNLSVIRRRADDARILGMVKANAYGHGIDRISRALIDDGVDALGVAFVEEGVLLRKIGINVPILVLTPIEPAEASSAVEHGLWTVVCSVESGRAIAQCAQNSGRIAEAHLYIDTGMHRDGVSPDNALAMLEELDKLSALSVTGICTHFATSDLLNDPFISEQLSEFNRILDAALSSGRSFAYIHAANTGAIWQKRESHFTLVRPGLSLYGYAAPSEEELLLRPVMSISTRVGSRRRIRAGETVSYGRKFMASSDTTILTLPIGYGDGYLRALTGKTMCLIRGKEYPIVGVICMDECMVDVGNDDVSVGEEAIMLGRQSDEHGRVRSIDAEQLASWAGTIPYEITTAVSARVPRRYIG